MSELGNTPLQPPRRRRSERHTASAPARSRRAGKRTSKGKFSFSAGKFPVRTVIVLGLVLVLAVLSLAVVRGNEKRLTAKREKEAQQYAALVERHTVQYREWIEKYAAENEIHPAFVAAVILRESSYNPAATSSVGARGLMQVMENTFDFVRGKLGEDETTFADMYDAETNIRYGCWYLGYLSRIFNGDPVKMACAYHAGPNNVKLWVMNYTADGQTLRVEDIPMEDTRYYAGKVVNAYAIYFQNYYPDAV